MSKTANSELDIERRIAIKKIELEQQKLEVERKKLEVEKIKARWTGLSILIPLLIVAITLVANSYFQKEQAEREFKIQAAQTVMDTDRADTVKNRAEALATLFPEYLSENSQ